MSHGGVGGSEVCHVFEWPLSRCFSLTRDLVYFSVEIGREKLRLGYEFDLPKFESRFNERLQRNPRRHYPSTKSSVVILECVAKPPTFEEVAKTLVDKNLPAKESVKPKKEPKPEKSEKLRRIGLKQNSDAESEESDLSLSSSSERYFSRL